MTATLTFVAVASTALMAGLWFAWAVSVIPGTRLVPDRVYVTTMQNINRAIINPGFIGPFLLTPALLAVAGIAEWRSGDTRRGGLLLAAGGTYLVGVLGVTFGGNVPLNNALDRVPLADATDDDLHRARVTYERPWNRWHGARTVANLAALTIALIAVIED
ncbi:MAG: DUF1772 domain-containing protein [Actinomycetota bacterium]